MVSEEGFELKEHMHLLWRWAWLIVLCTLIAGGAAYALSLQIVPRYRASTTVRIFQAPASSAMPDYQSLMTSERLSHTYAQMLQNRPVLEKVIATLEVPYDTKTLAENVQVTVLRDTQLLSLSVEDTDPHRAAAIANEIVTVFAEEDQRMQASRYATSKQNLEKQLVAIQDDIDRAEESLDALEGPLTSNEREQRDELNTLDGAISQ